MYGVPYSFFADQLCDTIATSIPSDQSPTTRESSPLISHKAAAVVTDATAAVGWRAVWGARTLFIQLNQYRRYLTDRATLPVRTFRGFLGWLVVLYLAKRLNKVV